MSRGGTVHLREAALVCLTQLQKESHDQTPWVPIPVPIGPRFTAPATSPEYARERHKRCTAQIIPEYIPLPFSLPQRVETVQTSGFPRSSLKAVTVRPTTQGPGQRSTGRANQIPNTPWDCHRTVAPLTPETTTLIDRLFCQSHGVSHSMSARTREDGLRAMAVLGTSVTDRLKRRQVRSQSCPPETSSDQLADIHYVSKELATKGQPRGETLGCRIGPLDHWMKWVLFGV